MLETSNNMPEAKELDDAQAATKNIEEKVENTESSAEKIANAQETSASLKPSLEPKKENEVLANKNEVPGKYSVHKANFEKDTLYLYQFSRTQLLPSLSPYCLKVETWLRLAGLKYQVCKLIFLKHRHIDLLQCTHFILLFVENSFLCLFIFKISLLFHLAQIFFKFNTMNIHIQSMYICMK